MYKLVSEKKCSLIQPVLWYYSFTLIHVIFLYFVRIKDFRVFNNGLFKIQKTEQKVKILNLSFECWDYG